MYKIICSFTTEPLACGATAIYDFRSFFRLIVMHWIFALCALRIA